MSTSDLTFLAHTFNITFLLLSFHNHGAPLCPQMKLSSALLINIKKQKKFACCCISSGQAKAELDPHG
jgi:hypothetical protein